MRYYFIHIRKTAGTSMRVYLRQCFGEERISPERSQIELRGKYHEHERSDRIESFDVLSGHFYDAERYFKKPRFVFTVLRDPIARTLSEVRQIFRDERDIYHEHAQGKQLRELLTLPELKVPLHNNQCRFLVTNDGGDFDAMSDEEKLEAAVRKLEKLDYFGLTEMFSTSLQLLSQHEGFLPPSHIPEINVDKSSTGLRKHVTIDEMDALYAANQLDLQLYSVACRIFDQRVYELLISQAS